MKFRKLLIPRNNEIRLNAIHFLSEKYLVRSEAREKGLIILCHGFPGDKCEGNRFPRAAFRFINKGFDALTFDFSGSGENPREPLSFKKRMEDLEIVYNWAIDQGYKNISVMGLSLGALIALYADLPNIKSYVFWAPALDIKNIIGHFRLILLKILQRLGIKQIKLRSSPGRKRIIVGFSFVKELLILNPYEKIKRIKKPILLIQGTEDKIVKPLYTRKAYNSLSKHIDHKLIEIEGTNHEFSGIYLERFIKFSINWIKKYSK